MKANKEVFAANLRHLRELHDKTQLAIAKELGVQEHRVNQWENGRCFPKVSMLIQVAAAYRYTDLSKLLSEEIKITVS